MKVEPENIFYLRPKSGRKIFTGQPVFSGSSQSPLSPLIKIVKTLLQKKVPNRPKKDEAQDTAEKKIS